MSSKNKRRPLVTEGITYVGMVDDKFDDIERLRRGDYGDDEEAGTAATYEEMPRHQDPTYEDEEFEYTDAGNAARLARDYGHKLKYVPAWGWLAYRDGKWQRDAKEEAMQSAIACVTDMRQEAATTKDKQRATRLSRHALRSWSEPRLQAMLTIAKALPGIVARTDEWDRDAYLLNAPNGTIDLRTGQLRKHDVTDRITRMTAVAYDPDATYARWDQFLEEITQGNTAVAQYIQRAAGYTVTGDTREEVFFFLQGPGRNGKGVLMETLGTALGDYAIEPRVEVFTAQAFKGHMTERADLDGPRMIITSEPEEGTRLDMAFIKLLTGGNNLSANKMFHDFYRFRPVGKLWYSANERTRIEDTSEGAWARVRLVPLTRSFVGHEDTGLKARLKREALPAVLAWAVRGCLMWQAEGLGKPETIRLATAEYRGESDTFGAFLDACVRRDTTSSTKGMDVLEAYQQWREEQREVGNDAPFLEVKALYKQLKHRGFTVQVGHEKQTYVYGMALRGREVLEVREGTATGNDDSLRLISSAITSNPSNSPKTVGGDGGAEDMQARSEETSSLEMTATTSDTSESAIQRRPSKLSLVAGKRDAVYHNNPPGVPVSNEVG